VARELLSTNRHLVAALRDALLERAELVGSEITAVLEAASANRPPVIDLRVEAAEVAVPAPEANSAP
jgi:hypothetical protein